MRKTVLGFIDIETTGHDPLAPAVVEGKTYLQPWHEIIDFGCVFAELPGLKPLGEYSTKIIPEHPERCLPNLINHFRERSALGEWKEAVPLETALQRFFMLCEATGLMIVPGGQNWFFDWSFLSVAFAFLGIDEKYLNTYLLYKRFDTSSMAMQALWNPETQFDMSNYSLRSGKLQKALGLPPEPEPHEAINGARQAYAVFARLTELKRRQAGG